MQVPNVLAPQGIHGGQTLVLGNGGVLPTNFTAGHGSNVQIQGGTVGHNFEVIGATVDLAGGLVNTVDVFKDAVLYVSGNGQWGAIDAYDGALVNIAGGSPNGTQSLRGFAGSTINIQDGMLNGVISPDGADLSISGGSMNKIFATHFSDIEITGGTVAAEVQLLSGSQLLATGGKLGGLQVSLGDSDLAGIATTDAVIDGAQVDGYLQTSPQSSIEVRKGAIGDSDVLGGKLIFRGGAMGDSHEWLQGTVEMHGYDFQFNGAPISGLTNVGDVRQFNFPSAGVITGVLSDGTPFHIAPGDNSQAVTVLNGVLRFIRTAAPTLPSTISLPNDPAPYGAADGQTVIVEAGGALGDHFVAGRGSIIGVNGGSVGDNFEADRSQVTIADGTIGNRMDVFRGAAVTVTGGTIGEELEVHAGGTLNFVNGELKRFGKALAGTVNMSGGLARSFEVSSGAMFNITGGTVESDFRAGSGSMVHIRGGFVRGQFEGGSNVQISGGRLGVSSDALPGSTITVTGGDLGDGFHIFSGANVNVHGGTSGDALTASGSSLAFHGFDFELNGVPISGLANVGDSISIVAGNQLFTGTFGDGTPFAFLSSSEDDFANATVRLVRSSGPTITPTLIDVPIDPPPLGVRAGQTLTLHDGGTLPDNFNAGRGSVVNILDGTVGENFEAYAAAINIEGGVIGQGFDAFADSQINVRGGSIGPGFEAYADSQVSIFGGSFISALTAESNSRIDIYGTKFFLNRVLIPSGQPFRLDGLNGNLNGLLADGSPFVWLQFQNFVHGAAEVYVHVVPEPAVTTLISVALVSPMITVRRARRPSPRRQTGYE
jgi:hypothetical protein